MKLLQLLVFHPTPRRWSSPWLDAATDPKNSMESDISHFSSLINCWTDSKYIYIYITRLFMQYRYSQARYINTNIVFKTEIRLWTRFFMAVEADSEWKRNWNERLHVVWQHLDLTQFNHYSNIQTPPSYPFSHFFTIRHFLAFSSRKTAATCWNSVSLTLHSCNFHKTGSNFFK